MKFIDNEGNNNPQINLALEEYIVRNFDADEDYLLFYINQPSVIIGKHQNTVEEINADYIKENNVIVIRRISGGGTVYHDFGNLNFSFLTKYDSKKVNNFIQFVQPIVDALHTLGVKAEMTGRNDIIAEGRKISGNAQFSTMKKMFSHGTLLFNSNIESVVNALNVSGDKITSKGIKSVRSRVANITEFLEKPMEMAEFRQFILKEIFKNQAEIPVYKLSKQQWDEVHQLSKEKYQTWEWNYGRSPDFNIQRKNRFDFGQIDARIDVKEGKIENIKFFGDFLGYGELSTLENQLKNQMYEQENIKNILEKVDLKYYFGNISAQELAIFLCD
ncbi:MAG: lipoate--protein ligase [Bacteroidetes bacterium]|nr:MAG: lipoate--protein ligase [Bacteroidota bacterium]TAG87810.1 MAG: lipoate--protein ligase [Bacteroidota bacterium]